MKAFTYCSLFCLLLASLLANSPVGYSIHRSRYPTLWRVGEGGAYWAPDCDFWGDDFARYPSRDSQCGGLCVTNARCDHFAWSAGTCYLKKKPASTLADGYPGAVCGWLPFRL